MAGYRNRPDLTAQAIDADGWLHTGDVGRIDDDGYVWIVDRKKELIINAAGKNMSPANIEARLKSAGPLIGQACVVGDRRPYNVALLVLDPDTAAGLDPADPDVVARVQEEVDAANAHLSRVEQIKRFRAAVRRVAAGRRRAHADDEAQAPPDRREVRRRDRRPLRLDSPYGMAERRLHGLQRVLGVNALFATAYGNVGSSIYYALGLVASFALGLTPIVFIITGFIFYLTAPPTPRPPRCTPSGMAERRLHGLQRVLGSTRSSHRLRQRRLVDLLRLGLVASFALGAHAGGLHHHRLHLLSDGRHLRRGHGDVPGGGRLVVLRAPRLQRVRVLLRRLGADAQLHDHDRHLGVLRAALLRQRHRRRRAAPQPGRHLLRHRRRRRPQPGQRRGRQGVGRRQHPAGRRRLPDPAAARGRRPRPRLLAAAR